MPRRDAPDPLTVAVALRETPLREATVAGGAAGLGRRIDAVAVLDVADLEAVRPNELVLVSAYALEDASLEALVRGLDSRGASGLGVKLDPYWITMPEVLVQAADAAGLPLLALPPGRFDDLVNPLLSAIVDRQTAALQLTAVLHRELTEAALRDDGLGSAAKILHRALGMEVAVFDEHGEMLASAGRTAQWSDGVADAAIAAAGAGPLECDGNRYLVAPVSAMGRRYGAVCVRGAAADDAIARAAIAEAAVVTGMQLLCRRQVEDVHRRFEHELLDDLVARRLSVREARERGERIGWPMRRPYLVLLVSRLSRGTAKPVPSRASSDEQASLLRVLRGQRFPVRAFRYRDQLACVMHLTRIDDPVAAVEKVTEELASTPGVRWAAEELVVAASGQARDIVRLPDVAREAGLTLTLSAALRQRGSRAAHFDGLGPARLLTKVNDSERLEAIARAELAPLGDLGDPGVADLIDTLSVLLAHNMRLAPAAAELFFHYNTVRHRLARLRELFGHRLRTAEGRLALWLALVALRVADFDADRARVVQLVAPRAWSPAERSAAA